jgi:hypothetical protein
MLLHRKLPLFFFALLGLALPAPRAGATAIVLLNSGICKDVPGTGITCTMGPITPSTSDLLTGHDTFELQATVPQGTWTASVMVKDSLAHTDTQPFPSNPITASGTYDLLFNQFSGAINFHDITEVDLTFKNSSAPNDEIDVQQFAAVPEPSTAGMMLLGLFGLAVSGRARKTTG